VLDVAIDSDIAIGIVFVLDIGMVIVTDIDIEFTICIDISTPISKL